MSEEYQDWLDDMEYVDTEERREEFFETHCQFCGCSNEYGSCDCDADIRY